MNIYHSELFPSNDEAVTETFVNPESPVSELAEPVKGLPEPTKLARFTVCIIFPFNSSLREPVSAFPKASFE